MSTDAVIISLCSILQFCRFSKLWKSLRLTCQAGIRAAFRLREGREWGTGTKGPQLGDVLLWRGEKTLTWDVHWCVYPETLTNLHSAPMKLQWQHSVPKWGTWKGAGKMIWSLQKCARWWIKSISVVQPQEKKNWGMGRGNNMRSMHVLDKTYNRPVLHQGRESLDVGELLQSHCSHLYDEVSWLSGVSCSCREA